MANKIDRLTPDLFKDGPGEYLAASVAKAIRDEKHFHEIFGQSVVDNDREDFSLRELPALRVYTTDYVKEQESHYINGNMHADVIFPPSIRREETERFPSRVAAALLQQFRRHDFFFAMRGAVPGLNELGKIFAVDKTLVYQNTKQDDECPCVKITLNFRIDLKQWDEYLESQGRTKDDPFDVTLENLREIATVIQGIHLGSTSASDEVEIDTDQPVGGTNGAN